MKWLILPLLALLVGVGLACSAGHGPVSTASQTPTATPATAADLPAGLVDFARQLDTTLATANVSQLAKSFTYQQWACLNGGSPPGAGPQCAPASPGVGGPGITLGVDGSEGDILDAESLTRYLADWTRNVPADGGSDIYGSGFPRVAAIAKMSPGALGSSVYGADVYAIITTKIAPPSLNQPAAQRTVLMFYAVEAPEGWLIPALLVTQVYFLDQNSEETQRTFTSWSRWLDVLGPTAATPLHSPISGWESPRSVRKVAFLDSSARLWVGNADGSDRHQLSDQVCGSGRWEFSQISWSRLGDRIGVLCPQPAISEPILEVYSAADGTLLGSVAGVYTYRWSPDGTRVAYEMVSSDNSYRPQVRIADLQSGSDALLVDNAVLLDWTSSDRLLVGENPDSTNARYTAAWYDSNTGRTAVAPEFDNGIPFWIAFDGKTAVVEDTIGSTRKDGAPMLNVINLDTGARVPINGAAVTVGITITRAVAINPYEAANQFFWVDSPDQKTMTISSASLDGRRITYLGRIEGAPIDLSWDGLMLYSPDTPASNVGALVIRDVISGAETQLSDIRIGAIRPPQPDDPRH